MKPLLTGVLFIALALQCAVAPLSRAEQEKIPLTTNSKEAQQEFVAGRTLVDNLRLTEGVAHFRKAAQADPGFALAELYLAQTAPTANEFFSHLATAVKLCGKASHGEQLWIKGAQAGAYANQKAQLEAYQKLTELFPRDERAHLLLGTTYFAQQDYAHAAESLQRAVEISPSFAPAYNQLGYAYRFLEKFPQAEATFKRYTELISDDPNPYDSYAELLLKLGRFDEAIVQYRKALALDEHFGNSYAGIAAALTYQGKYAEARAELSHALELGRTEAEKRAALFAMMTVSVDAGEFDNAFRELEKQYAIAKGTEDAAAMAGDLALKGNILVEQGKGKEALAEFTRARDLITASGLASEVKENAKLVFHFNATQAALAAKDLVAARREATAYRTGVDVKKNVNQIRFSHELEGTLALEQKDYARAVAELQQSNQQNPQNLLRLAEAYRGLGKSAEARQYATQAARFNSLPLLNYALMRKKAEKLFETL
jgi:tetratricopeptide (TPR) repeat protein